MAKSSEKMWAVVDLTNTKQETIWVRGKSGAHAVRDLLRFQGSAVHIYPEGYYPEFTDSGSLK